MILRNIRNEKSHPYDISMQSSAPTASIDPDTNSAVTMLINVLETSYNGSNSNKTQRQ